MNIGSIIKELRQKKKMSQEELAEYLGVSTQAVSRWETSVSYPDIILLPLIANVFNVTVDYLLGTDKFKNDKISRADETIILDMGSYASQKDTPYIFPAYLHPPQLFSQEADESCRYHPN